MEVFSDRVENIVGKGEKNGFQHFCDFHYMSEAHHVRIVRTMDCVVKS